MKFGSFLWLVMAAPLFAQAVEEDIRGPKGLIEIPESPEPTPWRLYIKIAMVVLLLIGALVKLLKQRKKLVATAEENAVRELSELEKRGGDLTAEDFALTASGIVRVFIERKFKFAAPKRTTEEFLSELATEESEALRSRMEPLRGFLKACDRAKFAGANLAEAERGELVAKARTFVEAPPADAVTMKEVA